MLSLVEFSKSKTFKVFFAYFIKKSQLNLIYEIRGPIRELYPEFPPVEFKEGKDLWKKTCFEAFFFEEEKVSYTELNFNANGEYSFLHFSNYRNLRSFAEPYRCLSIHLDFEEKNLRAETVIQVPRGLKLLISPTALLVPANKETLYFALQHGEKPDFHSKKTIESRGFKLLT